MNIKEQIVELRQKMSGKVTDAERLIGEGKLEEARALKEEAKELRNKIVELEELLELRGTDTATKIPVPGIPNGEKRSIDITSTEYRDAWLKMMVKQPLNAEEQRNLSVGLSSNGYNDTGSYTVPTEIHGQIIEKLNKDVVMRKLATVMNSGSNMQFVISAQVPTAGWTAEGVKYNETTVKFGNETMTAHKATAQLRITEELLSDSMFDLGNYVAGKFAEAIAQLEDIAFIDGDGSGKPLGVIRSAKELDATELNEDFFIDTVYGLGRKYRNGAAWLISDLDAKKVRKIKDSDGNLLWNRTNNVKSTLEGSEPGEILGYNVFVSENVPEGTILFGDFKYYTICDRPTGQTVKVLTEKYADTGEIGYLVNHRTDGKLLLQDAIVKKTVTETLATRSKK